jgi:hypothetical protein
MPEPLTPEERQQIGEDHEPDDREPFHCTWCGSAWPCPVRRLLDEVDRLGAELALAAEVARLSAHIEGYKRQVAGLQAEVAQLQAAIEAALASLWWGASPAPPIAAPYDDREAIHPADEHYYRAAAPSPEDAP